MQKILTSFFFILLFTVITVAQTMEPEAAKLYNQGNEKMKAGDFAGAVELYDQALAKAQDYRIYYQKAMALKKLNKLAESIPVLQECLKLKTDFDLAYFQIASSYYNLNNYQEAITNFGKAAEISQNTAIKDNSKEFTCKSYKFLAKEHYDKKQYDQAVAACNNVLAGCGDVHQGYANYVKGLSLRAKGDSLGAKAAYLLARKDTSLAAQAGYELVTLLNDWGKAYMKDSNFTAAVPVLEEANSYVVYAPALLSLAKAYNGIKEFDKAIATAESAIKAEPKADPKGSPAYAYYYMGYAYKGKGNKAEAKKAFTKAKQNPALAKQCEYELSLLK